MCNNFQFVLNVGFLLQLKQTAIIYKNKIAKIINQIMYTFHVY